MDQIRMNALTQGPAPQTGFAPDADERAYRDALGRFATGVTVITAQTDAGPIGITANSFSSVSLSPPLVLWSVDRGSRRFEAFANAANYCVHVLDETQQDLAMAFVRDPHAFAGRAWWPNEDGAPVLAHALARFECRAHAAHDGGDHAILVGRVMRADFRDGAPLLFSQGGFAGIKASA